MSDKFFIVEQVEYDLANLSAAEKNKLEIVSFEISVLDKYRRDHNNYEIKLPNNDVGTLSSTKDGWQLQIDVHNNYGYVNTFLYKLGSIPVPEQQHFIQHNIYAHALSTTALNMWGKGKP